MSDPADEFDRFSRTRDAVAAHFAWFGEVECPPLDASLYQHLCRGISTDDALLDLARRTSATQPPPNMLFAAVHYLLLRGADHPLRGWYPAFCDGTADDPSKAFPAFRAFCLSHKAAIEALLATRLTQTNVIQRCSVLLPAFAWISERVAEAPLALVEIGPSAGLNLRWDRFQYAYRRAGRDDVAVAWGDPQEEVRVECELRGEIPIPTLPAKIRVASRCGVDLHPIDIDDADAVLWLRALIWPEHVGRHERLAGAIRVARRDPPRLVQGDAAELLPQLLDGIEPDAVPCVYGTHTLYQFPRDVLRSTLKAMQAASHERPVYFASVEGTGERCSELRVTEYRGGAKGGRDVRLLANCNPHGRWLEWLDAGETGGAERARQ